MLYFKTSSCTEYSHPPQCWCLLVSHYLKSSTTLHSRAFPPFSIYPMHQQRSKLDGGKAWDPGNKTTSLLPLYSLPCLNSQIHFESRRGSLVRRGYLHGCLFTCVLQTTNQPPALVLPRADIKSATVTPREKGPSTPTCCRCLVSISSLSHS